MRKDRINTLLSENKKEIAYFFLFFAIALFWFFPYSLRENLGIFDWAKETFYFQTLHDSLVSGNGIPIFFADIPESVSWYPALEASNSYVGNPETLFLSPFLLAALLPVSSFFIIYSLLHLAVGILGTVLIGKKLHLSSPALFLLFCGLILSPWVIQHVIIGFTPWVTVYWLPLAVGLYLSRKPIWAGVVLSITVWEGGFHVYVWELMGIVFVLASLIIFKNWSYVKSVSLALVTSLILISPRLILMLNQNQELSDRTPRASYNSPGDLWGLLTDNRTNPYDLPAAYNIYGTDFYDGSSYVGVYALIAFTAAVLLGWNFINKKIALTLTVGIVFFTLLGWDGIWLFFVNLISPLSAEIYPYRFFEIAKIFALMLFVFSLEGLQKRFPIRQTGLFLLIGLVPIAASFYERVQFFIQAGL